MLCVGMDPPSSRLPNLHQWGTAVFPVGGGGHTSRLSASTVMVKARGAIELRKVWRMVNGKWDFTPSFVHIQHAQSAMGAATTSRPPFPHSIARELRTACQGRRRGFFAGKHGDVRPCAHFQGHSDVDVRARDLHSLPRRESGQRARECHDVHAQ